MAIVYRTAGAWGAGSGANLSAAQVDGNFYDVAVRVAYLEDNPPAAVSVDEITVIGNQMSISLTDASVQGPFTLPTIALNPRGAWAAETVYAVNDWFTINGSSYLVIYAHESVLTFDPGENDGLGHDYYAVLFESPDLALPPGGTTGQVLAKFSDDDFDTEWNSSGLPFGGTIDDVLVKVSNDDFDCEWKPRGQSTDLNVTTYTPDLDDAYQYLRCIHASGCLFTIPTNASVPFNPSTEITIRAATDNPVTLVGAGGVMLNFPDGFTGVLLGNGATAQVKYVGVNEWDVVGLLTPE